MGARIYARMTLDDCRTIAFMVLVSMLTNGGASPPMGVNTLLSASDVGSLSFYSAGTLISTSEGRFVPDSAVMLTGDLQIPEGPGPFPAVILAHGCGGVGYAEPTWVSLLNEWGYATFVVDSFKGRGISEVCTDARRLNATQRIPDAYGALRILATHPRIAPDRIALMGFSHGGVLALRAATVWAQETYATSHTPSLRAFFAFYPYCNTQFPEQQHISAPLRVHTGALDNWTPASACEELVASLKASGHDAAITLYPGAHHGFDILLPVMHIPGVENRAACRPRIDHILDSISPASISDCVTKGATLGRNTEALEQAKAQLRAELETLVKKVGIPSLPRVTGTLPFSQYAGTK